MIPASEVPYLTPLCVVLHEESVWIELLLLLETLMYTRTCMIPHVGTRIISHHTIHIKQSKSHDIQHQRPTIVLPTAFTFGFIGMYLYSVQIVPPIRESYEDILVRTACLY